jgi:hypothetical protein
VDVIDDLFWRIVLKNSLIATVRVG